MGDERDLWISDLAVTLEPGSGQVPLEPVVHGLNLRLAPSALAKLVEQAVKAAAARAPVEVSRTDFRLVEGGAEISARAGKGFMGAELTARLAISAAGPEVRVALQGLDAPRWLPLASFVEKGLERANRYPGVRADPDGAQAILVNPAAILLNRGVPARLAPGSWQVAVSSAALDLAYGEGEG
jgi:hypothetical protein